MRTSKERIKVKGSVVGEGTEIEETDNTAVVDFINIAKEGDQLSNSIMSPTGNNMSLIKNSEMRMDNS